MSRYVRSTLEAKTLYLVTNWTPDLDEVIEDYLDNVWGEHYNLDSQSNQHEKAVKLYWCEDRRTLVHVDNNPQLHAAPCKALQQNKWR